MMPPYRGYKGYSARRVTFPLIAGSLQIAMIVLFAIYGRYSSDVLPQPLRNKNANAEAPEPQIGTVNEYATFQDVHVMIFAGFGFLMTFLKRYGYSSVGVNFVLAAFCVQWAGLFRGFLQLDENSTFPIKLNSLLTADFAAATVLISFGAVLGKASPTQLIAMALVEIVAAQINEHIGIHKLRVTDAGESLFVHTFGAYFGLAVARVLYRDDIHHNDGESACYHSDIFAMIGTIFLWLFWPSFNGGALVGAEQTRAFINTYFSLATCCLVAFIVSWLCEGRYNMVHIQNSTLAGGVAIGTAADLLVRPFGAMIIGAFAAIISVIGYKILTPRLSRTLKIHDTCGVNNLHGMPGILAGFIGAMMASGASIEHYGLALYDKFPARLPDGYFSQAYNLTVKQLAAADIKKLNAQMESAGFGTNRSAPQQAAFQFLAIVVTLAIAIVTGTLTGFMLKLRVFHNIPKKRLFEDEVLWEVPDVSTEPKVTKTQENAHAAAELISEAAQTVEFRELVPLITKKEQDEPTITTSRTRVSSNTNRANVPRATEPSAEPAATQVPPEAARPASQHDEVKVVKEEEGEKVASENCPDAN